MDLMTIIMVFFVILWSINQGSDAGVDKEVGEQTVRMISLPGDVLFPAGRFNLSSDGGKVFNQLFAQDAATVLNFDVSGLVKRLLVIHGHTDAQGDKDDNFALGYKRAFSVYKAIQKYGPDVGNHVVLCTHADNSPKQEVPAFQGTMTPAQRAVLREANAKNRRITIEDKIVNTLKPDEEAEK